MFCRTKISTRLFFRLFLACCVVVIYIQIQLLPISDLNYLVRDLADNDKFPSQIVAWGDVCKPSDSIQDLVEYRSQFPLENTTKRLNIFRWDNIKGYSINSLLRQPWFPRQPSTIDFASIALVRHNSVHYGQWIVGYLHVDVTGDFKFALSSDDSSELWLSEDESPENSHRIAMVGDGYAPGWTNIGQHAKYVYQISDPILLKKCKKYFFEILHKQSQGKDFVALAWKRPGYDKFALITGGYLSPLLPGVHKDMSPLQIIFNRDDKYELLQTALRKQRFNKVSLEISAKFVSSQEKRVEYNKEKRSMVECQLGEYKRSPGPQAIEENIVSIYPMLTTHKPVAITPNTSNNKALKMLQENLGILSPKAAKIIVAKYLALVEDFHPGKYSLSSVINVESKKLPNLNERYLIELALQQQDSKVHVRISDYVLRKWADETICTIQELRWNSKTSIQVAIIITKDDGKRALHLIENLEDILEKNDDKDVHVTLVDYGQDYVDLHKVLSLSSIPNSNLIRKSSDFYKLEAIREAISSQRSSSRIVMVIDSHMKLPLDVMDQTRKHCIDGFMAFSPLAFHLNDGYSPAEAEGWWEYRGLPLIAMFKNDWEKWLSSFGNEQNDDDLESQIQLKIDVVRIKMDDLYYLTAMP